MKFKYNILLSSMLFLTACGGELAPTSTESDTDQAEVPSSEENRNAGNPEDAAVADNINPLNPVNPAAPIIPVDAGDEGNVNAAPDEGGDAADNAAENAGDENINNRNAGRNAGRDAGNGVSDENEGPADADDRNPVNPEAPDADGDGVVDASDAFPDNRYEIEDENNNQVGDNAEAVADGFNAFALDFFTAQAGLAGGQTTVVSPFSIAQALSMTLAGAREQTALELGNTLNLGRDETASDNENIEFFTSDSVLGQIHSFSEFSSVRNEADTSTFTNANSFWVGNTFNVVPDYNQRLIDYFDIETRTLDFSDSQASADQINAWVALNTNDEIESIVESGDLSGLTRAVLANAVYFKANWVTSFNAENTQNRAFYSQPDGGETQQASLAMMEELMDTQFYQGRIGNVDVTAVDLDYGRSATEEEAGYSRYSMTLLLPTLTGAASADNYANADLSLTSLQNALTWDNLEPFLNELDSANVSDSTLVRLPRFRTESDIDAVQVLEAMGLEAPFGPLADFSGISDESISIDQIKHKATIEVDEEGTVASAATGISLVGRSSSSRSVFSFFADRPFVYVIRDNELNTILFVGSFSG